GAPSCQVTPSASTLRSAPLPASTMSNAAADRFAATVMLAPAAPVMVRFKTSASEYKVTVPSMVTWRSVPTIRMSTVPFAGTVTVTGAGTGSGSGSPSPSARIEKDIGAIGSVASGAGAGADTG